MKELPIIFIFFFAVTILFFVGPVNAETEKQWVAKGDYLSTSYNDTLKEEAIIYYNRALEINPNNTDALSGRGVSLFLLGRYSEAIDSYNQALKIKPNNVILMEKRNNAIIKLNNQMGVSFTPINYQPPKTSPTNTNKNTLGDWDFCNGFPYNKKYQQCVPMNEP